MTPVPATIRTPVNIDSFTCLLPSSCFPFRFLQNLAPNPGVGNRSSCPTAIGNTYTLGFDIQLDNLGSTVTNPSACMDFGIYLFHSSNPPVTHNQCCLTNVDPQFLVLGASLIRGTYQTFSAVIQANGVYDRIVFSPFCNAVTPGCSPNSRMYFNVDNIVVQENTVLDEDLFSLEVHTWIDANEVRFDLVGWEAGRSYRIERSEDGIHFVNQVEFPDPLSSPGKWMNYQCRGAIFTEWRALIRTDMGYTQR